MPCVVADTSPLFYLAQLDLLPVLRALYGTVHVPSAVWNETIAGARKHAPVMPQLGAAAAEGWIVVSPDPADTTLSVLHSLDAGERAAIILARMIHADLVLIDEREGRSAAAQLRLKTAGTLGILAAAKREGLLTAVGPVFRRLRTETNFRFSSWLENAVLEAADELPNP